MYGLWDERFLCSNKENPQTGAAAKAGRSSQTNASQAEASKTKAEGVITI